jgi:hypothetical protein
MPLGGGIVVEVAVRASVLVVVVSAGVVWGSVVAVAAGALVQLTDGASGVAVVVSAAAVVTVPGAAVVGSLVVAVEVVT